ncbi:hypothetical protein, partial [Bacteroides caccae]|uniref:hypothetical protein n=1 Tax=Bacteroides caccae TaxID=47678 RepID=UPI00195F5059
GNRRHAGLPGLRRNHGQPGLRGNPHILNTILSSGGGNGLDGLFLRLQTFGALLDHASSQ